MKAEFNNSPTLFAFGTPDSPLSRSRAPYSIVVRLLENSDASHFPESERSIFAHVLEHEVTLYEQRGSLAGSMVVRIGGDEPLDLAASADPVVLPRWVEEDGLQFISCDAKGVLLVESDRVYRAMFDGESWNSTGLLLATGSGLPRAPMRRVLHRIQHRFGLPVYVLSDNDTWGYFLYSMLRRGALAPGAAVPYLAIEDVRHVGLHATSDCLADTGHIPRRRWREDWHARLDALRQYECFRSATWQAELDAFEKQKCARSLDSALDAFGLEYVLGIVNSAIETGGWLG